MDMSIGIPVAPRPLKPDERNMPPAQGTIIGSKEIQKAAETLRKYKDGKKYLEQRIIENERWYKLRHWDVIKKGASDVKTVTDANGNKVTVSRGRVEPASAWLFNSLCNKHADVMDNYPSPVILPREQSDEHDAKILSAILPVILERTNFEETYSDASWDKLKSGTAAYGVFWDPELENGLGDIKITAIDLLNIFWEPGITDIQDSRNLFIVKLYDNDVIREKYPNEVGNRTLGQTITVSDYVHDDTIDTSQKCLVVDWYYMRLSVTGKPIVHFVKFVDDILLYSSENDPAYQETGYYDHGRYPVEFDVLFPEKGSPAGFGFVDIMRQPQIYIDKLNQIILENAFLVGKPRYFLKEGGGINEAEFADWSKDIVHVVGSLDEDHIRQITVDPLPNFIPNHLIAKIDELKETSGNRDFSQGSTTSGVTAAAAIAALQEAGNKGSRDMIKGSYRCYRWLNYLNIELIRQFYDETREFRITGAPGGYQFIKFNNANLKDQVIPSGIPGVPDTYRRPVFDIIVKAEKTNPFSRASQNELAKELYSMGFFDPARAEMALGALELMDFEGKEKIIERVSQGQTLLNIIEQMRMEMDKMALIIQSLTGKQLIADGGGEGQTAGAAPQPQQTGGGKPTDAAQLAQGIKTTSYADRLASRSVPDVNTQKGVPLK